MFCLAGKGGEAKGFVAAFLCNLSIKRASGSCYCWAGFAVHKCCVSCFSCLLTRFGLFFCPTKDLADCVLTCTRSVVFGSVISLEKPKSHRARRHLDCVSVHPAGAVRVIWFALGSSVPMFDSAWFHLTVSVWLWSASPPRSMRSNARLVSQARSEGFGNAVSHSWQVHKFLHDPFWDQPMYTMSPAKRCFWFRGLKRTLFPDIWQKKKILHLDCTVVSVLKATSETLFDKCMQILD